MTGVPRKISARNALNGKIISIFRGPVATEVTLEIAPGVQIVSTITSHSAESLKLAEGAQAYAVIKASSVTVGAD
ncbi:TOBE domain-containing protein [Variovorax sp. SRS16]|uniref:TOBE domain-containing protein n=1 Tax=Variovorax sp. SRS16 TaxID=282217 RepID=UPI0013A570FD|nr:molybdopterin-binding protein [Variovorax sp. SRS16]